MRFPVPVNQTWAGAQPRPEPRRREQGVRRTRPPRPCAGISRRGLCPSCTGTPRWTPAPSAGPWGGGRRTL